MIVSPKGALALCAFSLLAAPVQAACWSPEIYRAAQVRQLDVMLTVGAIRCLENQGNFAAAYNRFIDSNGQTLKRAGETLHRHFAAQFGEAAAAGAYRSFVAAQTDALLNEKALLGCDELASAAEAGIAATSVDELARFAPSARLRASEESQMCRAAAPTLLMAARP